MKAAVLKGIKEPLRIEEVEIPAPRRNEVRIKIKAASLNRRDWWIQQGLYAGLKFPVIPGSDGSGLVESIGKNVNESSINKEVVIYPATGWGEKEAFQEKEFAILGLPENGTFAEYVKVPANCVFSKPAHLSFEETATLPVAGLTAYRALFVKGAWKKGEKVLISGAGGGAGSLALQWALAAGAEVWVTSGSEEKIKRAVALGAAGGVNYRSEDWDTTLKEQAHEFDIIIDSALGDGFSKLVALTARGGRIVFFGGTGGNIPALNGRPIFWKQISILGTTMGSRKDFANMLKFVSEKKIVPIVDKVFPLEDAEKAMRTMDTGTNKFGKTVLSI